MKAFPFYPGAWAAEKAERPVLRGVRTCPAARARYPADKGEPMQTKPPRLHTSNLCDKTYGLLKEHILQRKFNPDEKLSIPGLARLLGVSRTPIRDALNRLEAEGLVKTISKVGTYVRPIDAHDLLDIMDTRLMLELWVVDKLAARPPSQMKALVRPLEDVLERSRELLEEQTLDQYLRADYNLQFHTAFMQLGENRRNVEIYRAMMSYHYLAAKQSLFTKDMVISGTGQHSMIVGALKQGNFAEVHTFTRQHLEYSKERLLLRLQDCTGQA